MDFKILLGLLWPFLKEALFGRSVDPDDGGKKNFYHRVTDFFMNSHRATSALILVAILAIFVSAVSVRKLSILALNRETSTDTVPRAVDEKPVKELKPDQDGVSSYTVELKKREIADRIKAENFSF